MPKLGLNESIAVLAGLVIVGGFFLFFNKSAPVEVADEGQSASALQSIQGAIQSGDFAELVTEDLVEGTGAEAATGDTLIVHYAGILPDGTQFDNSIARGEPFQFVLGAGQVIPGWDRGLVGMKEGGRRILLIPPDLAYGDRATGNIPANSPLIFEVLLIGVQSN